MQDVLRVLDEYPHCIRWEGSPQGQSGQKVTGTATTDERVRLVRGTL